MTGKKIGKKLANDYMFQLIKFWSSKPNFHAKNQNSLGGGKNPGSPPLPFSNRDFSHQILKRMAFRYNTQISSIFFRSISVFCWIRYMLLKKTDASLEIKTFLSIKLWYLLVWIILGFAQIRHFFLLKNWVYFIH